MLKFHSKGPADTVEFEDDAGRVHSLDTGTLLGVTRCLEMNLPVTAENVAHQVREANAEYAGLCNAATDAGLSPRDLEGVFNLRRAVVHTARKTRSRSHLADALIDMLCGYGRVE